MITMTIIYVAGLISGILLVVIALAGWVRQAGKMIGGGDSNQAPGRHRRITGDTDTGTASMARHRANYGSRANSSTPRAA